MILISLLAIALLGYMVNNRRKRAADYPPAFYKPAAPVYPCDSCAVPHKFRQCGDNRFVDCAHYRDNIKQVGNCRFYVGPYHG